MKQIFLFLLLCVGFVHAEARDMGLMYTIQPGDTLTEIAEKECGSWRQYDDIYKYNFAKIENKDIIYAGVNIILPCKIKAQEERVLAEAPKDEGPKVAKEEPVLLARNIQNISTSQLGQLVQTATDVPENILVATEPVSDEIAKLPVFSYSEIPMTTLISVLERARVASNSTVSTSQLGQLVQTAMNTPETVPAVETAASAEYFAPREQTSNHSPAKNKKDHSKKTYQVVFNASGVELGDYPAIFLRNQDKNGEWRHRENMVARVEEINGAIICRVVFKTKPNVNSAAVIDFGTGEAILIGGDVLIQGETSEVVIPKKLKSKRYKALKTAFPTKKNPVLAAIRTFAPTGISSGLAYVAMGPIGLISAPATFAGDWLITKIRKDQRKLEELSAPKLSVQYQVAGQQSQIDLLKKQVEALQTKIESLQQQKTLSTNSDKEIGQ